MLTTSALWHKRPKNGVRFPILLFFFHFPSRLIKPMAFGFCFPLFRDLVSVDCSLDFLSGHGCAAQHAQPQESLVRWIYPTLCRFTPCTISSLRDAAMLSAIRLQSQASDSVLSFIMLLVVFGTAQWHLHIDTQGVR